MQLEVPLVLSQEYSLRKETSSFRKKRLKQCEFYRLPYSYPLALKSNTSKSLPNFVRMVLNAFFIDEISPVSAVTLNATEESV